MATAPGALRGVGLHRHQRGGRLAQKPAQHLVRNGHALVASDGVLGGGGDEGEQFRDPAKGYPDGRRAGHPLLRIPPVQRRAPVLHAGRHGRGIRVAHAEDPLGPCLVDDLLELQVARRAAAEGLAAPEEEMAQDSRLPRFGAVAVELRARLLLDRCRRWLLLWLWLQRRLRLRLWLQRRLRFRVLLLWLLLLATLAVQGRAVFAFPLCVLLVLLALLVVLHL
mmetsp:Transcript_60059/g.196068  ORF Transcript_60059/g.196068 Transcript_60059/m.196068 type:complete len:223 (-) Transcript_60059:2831-3499(-)